MDTRRRARFGAALRVAAAVGLAGLAATAPATATAQIVWLKQNVQPTDGTAFYSFGYAVAVSGNTAVVGAPFTAAPNSSGGVAYVFTESNGTWSESQEIYSSDTAASDFGGSVAFDGTTVVIGAYGTNGDQGAAYVFIKSNGIWTQVKRLTASDAAAYDEFGAQIAVGGSNIFVGAPGKNTNQGAVYIFSGSGSTWMQAQEFGGAFPNGIFGRELALSGSLAVIGAPGALVTPAVQGHAYIYAELSGTWTQVAFLTASDGGAGDEFGHSVAIDGTTALVGANSGCSTCLGAAYVFTDSGGTWTQTQKLTASNGAAGSDDFGASIALDGSTAIVGDPFSPAPAPATEEQGTLYVFSESSGTWIQTQMLTTENLGYSGNFGFGTVLGSWPAGVLAGDSDLGNGGTGTSYYFGRADLGFTVIAPAIAVPGTTYGSQTLVTNNATSQSPAVAVTIAVPAAASFISATSSSGSCSETSGVVSCSLGAIAGNAGTASADVTLKATGTPHVALVNRSAIVASEPPLAASATTTIDNPPVASNGTLTASENSAANGVLKATDKDNDPLTFSIVSNPAHGTVAITDAATGAYRYTPSHNYTGSDSFTFTANDGYTDSNVATTTITVKASSGGGGGGGPFSWLSLGALLGALGIRLYGARRPPR